jgi:hypothetical protein|nr:MAG TPA: hypothetical protein [Caudoviricetes sp.]
MNKIDINDVLTFIHGINEAGLFCAANRIFDSPECQKYADCTTACEAYAICHDIGNTRQYIWKKDKGA